MPTTATGRRSWRRVAGRSDPQTLVATGISVHAANAADPDSSGWAPMVALDVGRGLVALERFAEAIRWIERGLLDLYDPPVLRGQDGVRRPSTPAGRDRRVVEESHRRLAGLYLSTGEWVRAEAYLDWLALPHQPLLSRLAATRGQATLAAARGDLERAMWLVNTAAELANRSRSSLHTALVEADRAVVLAGNGRAAEATTVLAPLVARLAAQGIGEGRRWANDEAVVALCAVAAGRAECGDLEGGRHDSALASAVASRLGRRAPVAHATLAEATVSRHMGLPALAATLAHEACTTYQDLGLVPSWLAAVAEHSRAAEAAGHAGVARALRERYLAWARPLGLPTGVTRSDSPVPTTW